jgi:hypothetical protein
MRIVGRWTIVFCPHFFTSDKLKSLDERTKGAPQSMGSIAFLMTHEHSLAHEFMHVDMFGYRYKSKLYASIEGIFF